MGGVVELRPEPGYPTPTRAAERAALAADASGLVVTDERGRTTRFPLGTGDDAPTAIGFRYQNTGRGVAHYLVVLDGRGRRLVLAPSDCFDRTAARRFAFDAGLRWFDEKTNESLPRKAPGAVVLIRTRSAGLLVAMVVAIAVVAAAATAVSPWLLLLLPIAPLLAFLGVHGWRRWRWGRRRS
jgi:hypothetical protein